MKRTRRLLAALLCAVMACMLAAPALAAAPERDLEPPLWQMMGYDSYEEMLYRWSEEEYAETVAYVLNFMDTRPEETARLRANAYVYFAEEYASYDSPEEFMKRWDESEEEFVAEMTVYQILDLRTAEAYADEWAQLCREEPEATARFLAQLDGWFAREYGDWYGSLEEYCADSHYSCMEEAYLYLYRYWSWYDEAEQERAAFLTQRGGVPGQVNVMVDGRCLAFSAQRPVYVEDGVTYVDAAVLSQALGAELAADERGYVPLRAAAEGAGCRVWWDSEYASAVVVDTAALAEEIDRDFTICGGLLAKCALTSQAQRAEGSAAAEITFFDTLNGDGQSTASYSYDLTASLAGASGAVEYDFSALWERLESCLTPPEAGDAYGEQYAQQLELLRGLMKDRAQLRLDLENGMAYLSAAALTRLMQQAQGQAGAAVTQDPWFSFPLDGNGQEGQRLSIGALLCAYGVSAYGYDPVHIWDRIASAAEQAKALCGDGKFTRSGDAYVLTVGREDVLALDGVADELDGPDGQLTRLEYTLTVHDSGDVAAALTCRAALSGGGVNLGEMIELTASGSRQGGSSRTEMTLHIKNVLKMTLTLDGTCVPSDTAPQTAPPEGALVIPLDSQLP